MRRPVPSAERDRFTGNVRHYHRSRARTQRSWDDWVDGDLATERKPRNWAKILGIAAGLLALIGIIVGLLVEMA